MHFWNIDALANEIRNEKLTELQAFKYFVTVTLLDAAWTSIPLLTESSFSFGSLPFGFLIVICGLGAMVAGLIVCFKANERADGKDFIRRFICLSLPASFRTLVFSIPVLFLMGMLAAFFPEEHRHSVAIAEVTAITFIMVFMQFFIIYRRLKAQSAPPTGPQRVAA